MRYSRGVSMARFVNWFRESRKEDGTVELVQCFPADTLEFFEVTPWMREAGAEVLQTTDSATVSSEYLAEQVYIAMARLANVSRET